MVELIGGTNFQLVPSKEHVSPDFAEMLRALRHQIENAGEKMSRKVLDDIVRMTNKVAPLLIFSTLLTGSIPLFDRQVPQINPFNAQKSSGMTDPLPNLGVMQSLPTLNQDPVYLSDEELLTKPARGAYVLFVGDGYLLNREEHSRQYIEAITNTTGQDFNTLIKNGQLIVFSGDPIDLNNDGVNDATNSFSQVETSQQLHDIVVSRIQELVRQANKGEISQIVAAFVTHGITINGDWNAFAGDTNASTLIVNEQTIVEAFKNLDPRVSVSVLLDSCHSGGGIGGESNFVQDAGLPSFFAVSTSNTKRVTMMDDPFFPDLLNNLAQGKTYGEAISKAQGVPRNNTSTPTAQLSNTLAQAFLPGISEITSDVNQINSLAGSITPLKNGDGYQLRNETANSETFIITTNSPDGIQVTLPAQITVPPFSRMNIPLELKDSNIAPHKYMQALIDLYSNQTHFTVAQETGESAQDCLNFSTLNESRLVKHVPPENGNKGYYLVKLPLINTCNFPHTIIQQRQQSQDRNSYYGDIPDNQLHMEEDTLPPGMTYIILNIPEDDWNGQINMGIFSKENTRLLEYFNSNPSLTVKRPVYLPFIFNSTK